VTLPASPLLTAFRNVTAGVRATVENNLPRHAFLPGVPSALMQQTQDRWRTVEDSLDRLESALSALGADVVATYSDGDLTPEARTRRVAAVVQRRQAGYEQARTRALTATRAMLSSLRREALPARPTPADAAQEARLAGIKADVQMLTAHVEEPEELVAALSRVLTRAMGEDDELTVWLLAGSSWPEDFIAGRPWGPSQRQQAALLWAQESARALGQVGSSRQAEVRALYLALSAPKKGLPQLVTLLDGFAARVFEDLATTIPTGSPGITARRADARDLGLAG
jgi:hypothetical protein